ncbi:hypothetical protein M3C61_06940 [Dermacoccus abyssi]|uniref:hypothetical protein n=1 Tax=Dermacoccus abyssi TaxID=322596 RepID=UPI0021A355D7|nr:hypothetical protein [Dermacoccus abyssi]MCT1986754.1 hypothetical protein [Dermacoccus abyssi]
MSQDSTARCQSAQRRGEQRRASGCERGIRKRCCSCCRPKRLNHPPEHTFAAVARLHERVDVCHQCRVGEGRKGRTRWQERREVAALCGLTDDVERCLSLQFDERFADERLEQQEPRCGIRPVEHGHESR